MQVGVFRIVNAVGNAVRVEKLVGVGKTQRVVAQALDLVEQASVAAIRQPMRAIGGRFKAGQVDTGNAYRVITGIEKLRAVGMPVSLPKDSLRAIGL